jgi:ABC-2 type transport system ATP-binding protein
MIRVENLSKKFDRDDVLSNLSCLIQDNCIYGLVGANGAGKSTLLRLINGIFLPDEGQIYIDNTLIDGDEDLKQNMVFVPDDLFFYQGYTLRDMANFYKAMYKNFDEEYLKELAKILRLDMNGKINNFSKGMKRQCALICAFATRSKYMFFDETFDGIDPVIRNLMKKIMAKQMEETNCTIVMTSHNLRELEDICDNLGLLYKGGILFESDISSLKTNMIKVQISLDKPFDKEDFKDIELLNFKKVGSVATLIISDKEGSAKKKLEKKKPIILDIIPLTLEEVFIYEMEVLGYEFDEII